MIQANKLDNVTIYQMIHKGEEILRAYDKQDAAIDAKLLAAHLFGCNLSDLIISRDNMVPDDIHQSYIYNIAKRAQGMPLQYITKEQEFMGLPFYVDERVLIPRQDTEILVEAIIELAKVNPIKNIIDIGTGSGCISVALAYYIKDVNIIAIDISKAALDVAKLNIVSNSMTEHIRLLESDLLNNFNGEENSIDLIVSNPPYISEEEYKGLMREVSEHEPRNALTDYADGLSFYHKIAKQACKYLKLDGYLAFEIGYNQAEKVKEILQQHKYKNISIIQDLTKKDRVIIAQKA